MSKQTILKIRLPEGARIYPSRFRELLAKQNDLPEGFFHYENGRPRNGLPETQVVGGKGWVGVLASGDAQRAIVAQATGTAIRAASAELGGRPVQVAIEDIEFAVRDGHMPITYFIREMAIKRRHPGARTADVRDLIERRLRQALARQAESAGLDMPVDYPLQIAEVTRERGLRLETASGMTNEYVHLVDASFSTTLVLSGIWMCGNLTARGYGRIIRDVGQFSTPLEIAA